MDVFLAVLAGLVVGIVAALKVIAPKTKTTADDKVLSAAEKVEPFVKGLADKK